MRKLLIAAAGSSLLALAPAVRAEPDAPANSPPVTDAPAPPAAESSTPKESPAPQAPAPGASQSSQGQVTTAPGASQPTEGQASVAAPAPAPAKPSPPPKPTLIVNIDLSKQRMTVSENGQSLYTWPISTARYGYRTATGTFKPQWMTKMWYSRQYDYSPMPHAIFFNGGIAIHGTGETGSLGRPASHGCVRLAPGNAAKLYKLVQKHGKEMTRIVVHGTPPQRPPAVASRQRDYDRRYDGYAERSYSRYDYGPHGDPYGYPPPRRYWDEPPYEDSYRYRRRFRPPGGYGWYFD